jgi:hypothetical protein
MAQEGLPEETVIATAKIMENTSFSIRHVDEFNTYNSMGNDNVKQKPFTSTKVIPTFRGV